MNISAVSTTGNSTVAPVTIPIVQDVRNGVMEVNTDRGPVMSDLMEHVRQELIEMVNNRVNQSQENPVLYNISALRDEIRALESSMHVSPNDTRNMGGEMMAVDRGFWQMMTDNEEGYIFLAILAIAG